MPITELGFQGFVDLPAKPLLFLDNSVYLQANTGNKLCKLLALTKGHGERYKPGTGDKNRHTSIIMSSNENFKSPVTPTATLPSNQSAAHRPLRRSFDQKMDLRKDMIERDSEDFYSPAFTTKQLNFCREALKRLKMKKADTGRRIIDREFDTLTVHRLKSYEAIGRMKAAQLNVNMRKNRYVDVLPFDETRVVLNVPNGVPDTASDYINASYVVDSANDKLPTFIATQGPLRSTVADFWEMIFEQRCPVIVMLTSLLDGNQEKCAPYFPMQAHQSRVYGNWCITTKSLNYSRHSIAKRVLEVQSSELPNVSHTVLHCEYLHWPDNHVPPSTRPSRELFRCLLNVPIDAGPFVVHCSAGIGRTGTYCTIDHTLRRILAGDESALDIMSTVGRFREQRVGMVQTREQYHFCYEAVIDELDELLQL